MHRDCANIATLLLTISVGSAVVQARQAQDRQSFAFRTVSVEPSTGGPPDIRYSRNSFTATAATLTDLIAQAYDINAWHIFGGPDWVRVDRFNVRTTTAEDVSRDEMNRRLQALFADRFKLQLAREFQMVTLYRLTRTSVRNLKPAGSTDRPVINAKRVDNGAYRWEGRSATMANLAAALSQHLRASVIDDTRLNGAFDFAFEFAYADALANVDSDPRNVPPVFAALEEQLGLMLISDKGLIPGYVIDRVARPSS